MCVCTCASVWERDFCCSVGNKLVLSSSFLKSCYSFSLLLLHFIPSSLQSWCFLIVNTCSNYWCINFSRALSTPNTTFEESLVALKTGNVELLEKHLSAGIISADSADGSKNSLLHYAVAIGNIDIIRTICNKLVQCVCVCMKEEGVWDNICWQVENETYTISYV